MLQIRQRLRHKGIKKMGRPKKEIKLVKTVPDDAVIIEESTEKLKEELKDAENLFKSINRSSLSI